MEQLDKLDGNGQRRKTNTNHFAPLFKPADKEYNKHSTKPESPIIVLSEYEEERKTNKNKTRVTNKMKITRKIRKRKRWTTLAVTMYLTDTQELQSMMITERMKKKRT